MSEILEAPCVFCAYNGHGYWQVLTHDEKCPWRHVAGSGTRTKTLRDVLISRSTPPVAQEPVAWRWRRNADGDWQHEGFQPMNIPAGAVVEPLFASPRPDDARNEVLEEAARVCDAYGSRKWDEYKGRSPSEGGRANSRWEGMADAANELAEQVRGLKGGG